MAAARQIFDDMRILLFIGLTMSMALSPALASASCVSMDADSMVMADGAMAKDCGMNSVDETDVADCAAACALMCPGFYSGPELASAEPPSFQLTQHIIPAADPGIAMPAYLDPPPPRF